MWKTYGLKLVAIAAAAAFSGISALLVYAWWYPAPFVGAMKRLVDPFGGHPVITATRLHVDPGDTVAARGGAVTVKCALDGALPRAVRLYESAGGIVRVRRLAVKGNEAVGRLEGLDNDVRYRVRAGDALSRWFLVKVVDRPVFGDVSVEINPPRYTHIAKHTVPLRSGLLEVPVGSRLRFVCRGDGLAKAWLAVGGHRLAMERVEGTFVAPEITVGKAVKVELGGTNAWGISTDPLVVSIEPVEDAPPLLTLDKPVEDVDLLPGEHLRIEGEARDDYGVVSVEAAFALLGDASSKGRLLLASSLKQERALKFSFDWDIPQYNLDPGTALAFVVEVVDNAEPSPHVTRSRTFRVRIVSYADHMATLLRMQREVGRMLAESSRSQLADLDRVEKLASMKDEVINSQQASLELREAVSRQVELSMLLGRIASRVNVLLSEMRRNVHVSADSVAAVQGVRSRLPQLGEMVRRAASILSGAVENASPARKRASLMRAAAVQKEAAAEADALARRLADLRRLTTTAMIRRRLEELAARQRDLAADASPLVPDTAGRKFEQLERSFRDILTVLSERQGRIGEDLEKLKELMQESRDLFSDEYPAAVRALSAVLGLLKERRVAGAMKELKEQLGENRLFSVVRGAERVAADLEDAAALLKDDAVGGSESSVPEELARMMEEQRKLRKEIRRLLEQVAENDPNVARMLDELRRRQQMLAARLAALAAQMGRLETLSPQSFGDLAEALRESLARMRAALKAMRSGNLQNAARAQRSVEEMLGALLQQLKSVDERMLKQVLQTMRAVGNLRRAAAMQKDALDRARRAAGRLGPGPHRGAKKVAMQPAAGAQRRAASFTAALEGAWPSFLGGGKRLSEARRRMEDALRRMEKGFLDDETLRSQQAALEALEKVLQQAVAASGGKASGGAGLLSAFMRALGGGGRGGGGGRKAQGVPGGRPTTAGKGEWAHLPAEARKAVMEAVRNAHIPPRFKQMIELYMEGMSR